MQDYTFFQRESNWLRRFFLRRRIPRTEVEDVVQDTWTKLVQMVQKGRVVDGDLGPLVGGVAKIVLRERRRTMVRHPPAILIGDLPRNARPLQLQPSGPKYRGEGPRGPSMETKRLITSEHREGKMSISKLAAKYGVSRTTIMRYFHSVEDGRETTK
jgi:hypothetical protein